MKTETLNFGKPITHDVKQGYKSQWDRHNIKYLGEQVPQNLDQLYNLT